MSGPDEAPSLDERTDQERKDGVRRTWLTEHGGEAVRLEAAVVAEIAYRLVEEGLQPTVDTIRYVNGGQGSPNVIHPAVRQFFRGELRRRWASPAAPDVPGVPAALVELWNRCVQDAQRAADAALEAPRAELARLQAALQRRSDEVEAMAEQQQAELHAVRHQAADLAARLDRAQGAQDAALARAHAAETALAMAQADLKAQREVHKTFQAQVTHERATLAKERDRWRTQAEDARREAAELATARDGAERRLAEHQSIEHDLRAALAATRTQIEDLRGESQRAAAQSVTDAAARQAAHDAATQAEHRANMVQERLHGAEERIRQLQSELDGARTALIEAAHRDGELQALRGERDRLAQLLATNHDPANNPDKEAQP